MLYKTHAHMLISTCAAECMREHLSECLEFISDIHTLSKVKVNVINQVTTTTTQLNSDLYMVYCPHNGDPLVAMRRKTWIISESQNWQEYFLNFTIDKSLWQIDWEVLYKATFVETIIEGINVLKFIIVVVFKRILILQNTLHHFIKIYYFLLE